MPIRLRLTYSDKDEDKNVEKWKNVESDTHTFAELLSFKFRGEDLQDWILYKSKGTVLTFAVIITNLYDHSINVSCKIKTLIDYQDGHGYRYTDFTGDGDEYEVLDELIINPGEVCNYILQSSIELKEHRILHIRDDRVNIMFEICGLEVKCGD